MRRITALTAALALCSWATAISSFAAAEDQQEIPCPRTNVTPPAGCASGSVLRMRIIKRSWRRGRSIAGIGALGLVSALALVAAPETEAPYASGDEIPNFALLDQRGRLP